MSLTTRVGVLAGAAALTLTGASFADNPADSQDVQARIAELEAQVAQLKGDDWMTEQRAEEIRGLVQDVLADADTRASLLQGGISGGYDDGFVLGSSDGRFSLRMNGQLQTRFIYNNQGDDNAGFVDGNRWGFENTRTKLMFSGNVGSPEWTYYVEGNFFRSGGEFELDDAWISYDMGNGWSVAVGQTKVPLNREFLVHSSNQLAVERSNVSYLYNGGRTQGVLLDYASDQWHFTAGYTDGAFQANGPWQMEDTEFAGTARMEFLLSGNWDQFEDFTSPPGSEQGWLLGGGIHYEREEYGTLSGPETELLILSADLSAEFDGANLFFNINYADVSNGVDFSPIGAVIQGGYYFMDDFEGFVRYEYNDFDIDGVDDLSLLTLGVNKYMSPNVTLTSDIGYGFDSASGVSTITGWRNDLADEDGQFVWRTQLQLIF